MQLLDQVQQQLCRPLPAPQHTLAAAADADARRALAAAGWQLLECVPCYYLTLQHPVLGIQLDVQVGQGEKRPVVAACCCL
jgi:hypothetical protein